jgi:hypothetical protein
MRGRRKPDRGNFWKAPRTDRDDFLNLHDAFMNASLQRSRMLRSSMQGVDGPEEFFMSDRGRFERTYAAFVAVLVEAWAARRYGALRSLIGTLVSTDEVNAALLEARKGGGLERLRAIRGYMFHRDERQYWDYGRVAVVDLGGVHERLYWAFSRMFLAVFRSTKRGTLLPATAPEDAV